MRIIPLLFRIFLISLIVGLGFTLLQAQENPDEFEGRIGTINREILQIEEQQRELEMQLREELSEDQRREKEMQLNDLSIRRESLIRERESLEKNRQPAEEPTKEEPSPEPSPDGRSFWEPFKQPGVIAAAIGAVGVIVAALTIFSLLTFDQVRRFSRRS